jgi:hypothetical protein
MDAKDRMEKTFDKLMVMMLFFSEKAPVFI